MGGGGKFPYFLPIYLPKIPHHPPIAPAFIYFIKDATFAVRLLAPLNLRSKTAYASQPPQ